MRKLGEAQEGCLDFLHQFGWWRYNRLSGWNWDTPSSTKRILDSLVKRGLAKVDADGLYTPVGKKP